MKAKDTVMNNSGIVRATWVNPNYPKDSPVMRAAKPSEVGIAQVQAEITWDIAFREGYRSCEEPKGMESMTKEEGRQIIREILTEAQNIKP